jgi:O-antigen ligase
MLGGYSRDGLSVLRVGWVIAYVIAGCVAVWELGSGQHLPGPYVEVINDRNVINATFNAIAVVISTFGNPDTYAVFIAGVLPYLLWTLVDTKRVLVRLFCAGLLGTAPMLLALSEGRTATATAFIICAAFVFLDKSAQRHLFMSLIAVVALGLLFWAQLQLSDSSIDKFTRAVLDLASDGSAETRYNLVWNGLWFLWQSRGLGVGAGAFESHVINGNVPYPVGIALNAHNVWIEILSQYGVIVFCVWISWFVYAIAIALKAVRTADSHQNSDLYRVAIVLLLCVFSYTVGVMVPGSAINSDFHWVWLGTIAMGISYCERRVSLGSVATEAPEKQ